MRVEAEPRCEFGCPWSSHIEDGRCERDCLYCEQGDGKTPSEPCAGHQTRVNRYRPQIQLI